MANHTAATVPQAIKLAKSLGGALIQAYWDDHSQGILVQETGSRLSPEYTVGSPRQIADYDYLFVNGNPTTITVDYRTRPAREF